MRFDFDKHTSVDDVMLCETELQAEKFLSALDALGRHWVTGKSYIETTHYEAYNERTCYYFNTGRCGYLGFAKDKSCNIFVFSDYEWDGYVEPTFEVGKSILDFLNTI